MPFNTVTFFLFFMLAIGSYWLASSWQLKKIVLLFFSQVFYAAWNPPFVILLWIATLANWLIARQINSASSGALRRFWLISSLFVSLGLLGFFKYGDFLLVNFTLLAKLLSINFQPMPFNMALPIGISFYTFHALSYTIDIYRRNSIAIVSFSDFALYMSFFPQLVAGPIVRASHFLPQLKVEKSFNKDHLGWGLVLFSFGLFQKSVLADAVFAPVVDQLYAEPGLASAWDAWIGVLAFSGQIFCDFAGYSTCAIGLALCFGFHFPENFRAPYGAVGFSDFWRRWHISLSSWLRDYLYIPLGGSRSGLLATSRALMLTMLLGGLWHGASWMFLLWGGLHGLYLLTARSLRPVMPRLVARFSNTGLAFATFLVVTLTWIPFRAEDGSTALAVLVALFRADFPVMPLNSLLPAFVCGVGMVWWHIAHQRADALTWFVRLSNPVQALVLGFCLVGIFLTSGGESRGFIYFQF